MFFETLNWNGKLLSTLDYEETIEFEKEVLKRIVTADRSGMSDTVIKQLQSYLDVVKMHKEEQLAKYKMDINGNEEKDDVHSSMIIGEQTPENDED